MFDLATQLQPAAANPAALAGLPFDLRLTPPAPARSYPYTTWINSAASGAAGSEVLATYALALEGGLATAVHLSLFTDRRAGPDDALPHGQTDRRGWVGDEFMPEGEVDPWGSLLWLIYTGKVTGNVLELARFAAREALAWLLRDGIAGRVDVTAEWRAAGNGQPVQRLVIRPTIWQPDQVRPVYDVLWGTSVQRWAQT